MSEATDDHAAGGTRLGPVLTSERLLLRRWSHVDAAPFAAMNADPEVMRYFVAPLDRAASDGLMRRIEEQFDRCGYGLWALEERETSELLGFTGLIEQTFEAHFTPAVEIGWRLRRSAWGHGFATEAARVALAYAFGPADLTEVVSMTTRTNAASQAVMKRLGMTCSPDDDFEHPRLPPGHRLRPHVLHRLTRRQWQAQGGLIGLPKNLLS